jgi:hypothetical protein
MTAEEAVIDAQQRFRRRTGGSVLDSNRVLFRVYRSHDEFLADGRALSTGGWWQEVDPDADKHFTIRSNSFLLVTWRR